MRSGRGVLLAGCAALALSGCAGPAAEPASVPQAGSPSSSSPAAAVSPPSASAGGAGTTVLHPAAVPEPTSVSIPDIGVQRDLVDLGLAEDGTAEVPADFDDAGWFTGGGRPGSRGPTVLLGHVDSTAGPAVFSELRDLVAGDVVEVTVADGTVARYAVTGTEQVPKDRFPTAAVFGATTADVLRLVTCTGDFDRGARSYVDNLVVTAERIG